MFETYPTTTPRYDAPRKRSTRLDASSASYRAIVARAHKLIDSGEAHEIVDVLLLCGVSFRQSGVWVNKRPDWKVVIDRLPFEPVKSYRRFRNIEMPELVSYSQDRRAGLSHEDAKAKAIEAGTARRKRRYEAKNGVGAYKRYVEKLTVAKHGKFAFRPDLRPKTRHGKRQLADLVLAIRLKERSRKAIAMVLGIELPPVESDVLKISPDECKRLVAEHRKATGAEVRAANLAAKREAKCAAQEPVTVEVTDYSVAAT